MPTDSLAHTPLHGWHLAHGGRMVEFGGWSMPVQYTTVIDEHTTVRERVGLFDIGHMGRLHFDGPDVLDWLERSTTNHVSKLAIGQIQYSLMVNESGGVLDDILVYRLAAGYLVVCNASNRAKVVAQFESLRGDFQANLVDRTIETAMIAIQGPAAVQLVQRVLADHPSSTSIRYYHFDIPTSLDPDTFVSRTGYTGEDGFEIITRGDRAVALWDALISQGADFGVRPCGLGARDTLRFEASMPLYGHEMDESVDPYSAGLGWAVKLNKGEFEGRDALRDWKRAPKWKRIGLALEGKRMARQGAIVLSGERSIGRVTSGTFAPTLEASLAMALIEPAFAGEGTRLTIDVRGKVEAATVVPLPFYRRVEKG